MKIIEAKTKDEVETARTLFLEYASSLNFNLCFQNFDEELKNLPGEYSVPYGCILIAFYNDEPAGCVALRKIEDDICEMKRLYVKDNFRGKNIGRKLVEEIIKAAKGKNFNKMRLDTVPNMKAAQKLYRQFGFYEIDEYRENPVEGAIYMELDLTE